MSIDMMMEASTIIYYQAPRLREKLPDTPSLARLSLQNPLAYLAGSRLSGIV